MKYKCSKCKAVYFHNHAIVPAPEKCRFCNGDMRETKMTDKEFNEIYLNPESALHK